MGLFPCGSSPGAGAPFPALHRTCGCRYSGMFHGIPWGLSTCLGIPSIASPPLRACRTGGWGRSCTQAAAGFPCKPTSPQSLASPRSHTSPHSRSHAPAYRSHPATSQAAENKALITPSLNPYPAAGCCTRGARAWRPARGLRRRRPRPSLSTQPSQTATEAPRTLPRARSRASVAAAGAEVGARQGRTTPRRPQPPTRRSTTCCSS